MTTGFYTASKEGTSLPSVCKSGLLKRQLPCGGNNLPSGVLAKGFRSQSGGLLLQAAERPGTGSGAAYEMSYKDFVWFILSEEDKSNDVSLEYWFRCVDLDADGRIDWIEMLVDFASGWTALVSYKLVTETLPSQSV